MNLPHVYGHTPVEWLGNIWRYQNFFYLHVTLNLMLDTFPTRRPSLRCARRYSSPLQSKFSPPSLSRCKGADVPHEISSVYLDNLVALRVAGQIYVPQPAYLWPCTTPPINQSHRKVYVTQPNRGGVWQIRSAQSSRPSYYPLLTIVLRTEGCIHRFRRFVLLTSYYWYDITCYSHSGTLLHRPLADTTYTCTLVRN